MNDVRLEWRQYRFLPYERDFARREAESVFQSRAIGDEACLRVPARAFHDARAERLTYFARVVSPNGRSVIPRQTQLEETAHVGRRVIRQSTRYSAHGLHEYKGKFNPQIVRAIGNIIGLSEDSWVLDPFCGSGTTLLECAHTGWNATGLDRNPLAIHIANAKLAAIRNAERLLDQMGPLVDELSKYAGLSGIAEIPKSRFSRHLGDDWMEDLPAFDYLRSWFPLPVLAQVVAVLRTVRTSVRNRSDRSVFEVILSDCVRASSLQEPADLRIRRRKDAQPNYPILEWFIEAVQEQLPRIARARNALGRITSSQNAVLGDNRELHGQIAKRRFDAVITSPPYETALPYIDTQRLSLVLLGHIPPTAIQSTEQALTGARDISPRERRDIEAHIVAGDAALPREVVDLCRELLGALAKKENGFRRRNRPALVYRYFHNMAKFFTSLRNVTTPGAKVALVVGPSRTTLSGKEFIIDTPGLLGLVGEHCGFKLSMTVPMNTYPRYDLHQRNSIGSEVLTVLNAPSR